MLLVDAVYIHESGGKTLLEYFVRELYKRTNDFYLLLDKRLVSGITDELPPHNYTVLQASEAERIRVYKKFDKTVDTLFCFANVPPPQVSLSANVYIFFQNTLIVSSLTEKNSYTLKRKLSFLLRRLYIRYRSKKEYQWIVQTPSMKSRLTNMLGVDNRSVSVLPFFETTAQTGTVKTSNFFLYVADGVPQKNHTRLFDAWVDLYTVHKLSPALHVTLPERFTEHLEKIRELTSLGINIVNHGVLPKNELQALYQQSEFLVFPSLAESFGLPLIEAATAGCKIIAADLPYVFDIVTPTAVFDPLSAKNIAQVVADCVNGKISQDSELRLKDHVNELLDLLTGQPKK